MAENFENINSLLQKIREDKNTRNVTEKRFPVRYIFLSNFDTLKSLVKETIRSGIQTFELSQLLPKDDGWMTKQEFIDKIKSLNPENDFLLLPFSEVARFYNKRDFNNLFSQLTELENTGKSNQRIYIPLMGIRDRFENEFYQNFNRKIEYSFTWEIFETIKRSTVFLNNDLSIKIDNIQKVNGTKEWLTLWKNDLATPTLCLSKTLFFLSDNAKPDEIFDFKKINNFKELIKQIFKIEIPIEYIESEKDFWVEIIKQLNKKSYTSFYNLVKDIVNTTKITIHIFIELWLAPKRNDFEKWLIKNYILSHDCIKDYYLCHVISNSSSLSDVDLLMELWLRIFNITNPSKDVFEHRIILLKQFYDIKQLMLPENIINDYQQRLEGIKDEKRKLNLITGLLGFEKEFILKLFAENQDLSILDKYQELHEYLDEIEFDNLKPEQQWVNSYLKEYKISKIKNKYTSEISEKINFINNNEESFYKWYYSFDEVTKFLNANNFDYIFWIDALGIEWVGLIDSWIKEKNYNFENKFIARVNLPTTTEANRYNKNNIKYIQDFDKFIHDGLYQYPNTIIAENKKLKEILDSIILQKNKRAIIVSDHGLSALVRLNDSSKNFPQSDHEGRYISSEEANSFKEDENYIIKDNYIIASKHISLSTKPKREVHGGCTPEEVLVPVIIFNSTTDFEKRESYNITLISKEIDIKKPIVVFNVSPIPTKKVYAFIERNRIELKKDKNDNYSSAIEIRKQGAVGLKVKIGNFEKDFNTNVKSGFKEEDLF